MKTKQHQENERNPNPKKGQHQQRSVLWIGFVLLISGWTFFLGVLVGRGTAPALFDYQQIETEITALAKIFTESRKAQPDMATDTGLEYPEELKKKTEDNTLQMQPQEKPPVRPAETPRPVQQVPAQVPTSPPARSDTRTVTKLETIEPPEAIKTAAESRIKSMYDLNRTSQTREMPPVAPERTPSAVPKPRTPAFDNALVAAKAETVQPLAIHLTSMVDKKSADILIEILRNKGISASKTPKMIRGKGVWYTVVVGKFTSSAEADAMLNRLKQENMDASLVRQ